jgi:pyruvate/2-oxoglutarate/acetoin dehydrogenase E1 component
MGKYRDEICRSMEWLGSKSDTFFLGQAVKYKGTAMTDTLINVPTDKLFEVPVCEDMQMGMSIGMSINGTVPISLYPRWNFFLLATNQLVNHLDKIPLMSDKPYKPKIIIRVGIGSERPLHPQHQHIGDYTDAFKLMCKNVDIIRLDEPDQIFESYQFAYERTDSKSTILIEWGDFYNEK